MRRRHEGLYLLGGEAFTIRRLPEGFALTHERWPIMGTGRSLRAAAGDLARQSAALLAVLEGWAEPTLNDQGRAMLAFQRRLSERHEEGRQGFLVRAGYESDWVR